MFDSARAPFQCDRRTGEVRISSAVQALAWQIKNLRASELERLSAGERLAELVLDAAKPAQTERK